MPSLVLMGLAAKGAYGKASIVDSQRRAGRANEPDKAAARRRLRHRDGVLARPKSHSGYPAVTNACQSFVLDGAMTLAGHHVVPEIPASTPGQLRVAEGATCRPALRVTVRAYQQHLNGALTVGNRLRNCPYSPYAAATGKGPNAKRRFRYGLSRVAWLRSESGPSCQVGATAHSRRNGRHSGARGSCRVTDKGRAAGCVPGRCRGAWRHGRGMRRHPWLPARAPLSANECRMYRH